MDHRSPSDHALFERLCLLRGLYERRGPRDRVGVLTVSEAVRYAEALLAIRRPAADLADLSAESTV